jgi:competence protein ComEC
VLSEGVAGPLVLLAALNRHTGTMRTGRHSAALIVAVGLASCAPRTQPPAAAPTPPGPFIVEALDVDPEDVYIRVVDVGPGLCVIICAPGDHFMVYDAGHWVGQHCVAAVRELVTTDAIDLLVISHSDGDHLGDAADILAENAVSLTLLAGEQRETAAWKDLVAALATEVTEGGSVHNLQSVPLVTGRTIPLGEAVVTLVAGWKEWTAAGPTASERLNAISVVVRLDYRGRSVLFTGDTVGRRLNDPDSACKDAEKIMVDNHVAGTVSLKADVLIASHHGANNGSSDCFIQAIAPQFVVFSSGHDHEHPTLGATTRFLNRGVPLAQIFRTDFGDDEPGTFEWKVGSVPGCSDPRGDDDVEIALRGSGAVDVDYLRTPQGFDSRIGS